MFVFGKVSDTIKKGHEAALQIQSELIEIIKPGISCETIYETAMKKAEELNLLENFMGLGKDKVKFIGHGVGLELDELPVFAPKVQSEIQPGMTFALEPKFVFPEGAVGIENTFVLREDGVEKLTNAPEEIVSC